jgi:hypothetical protein
VLAVEVRTGVEDGAFRQDAGIEGEPVVITVRRA